RTARHLARHRAAVAARDGRPCGVERRARHRRQPRRGGARPDLLRHQLHHRRARRYPGGAGPRGRRRHHRDARSRPRAPPPCRLRLLPRSPPGTLRPADAGHL
ncbi:hypothetical protein LTR94_035727, partial [Friedmanniomyces endolithicus]